MENVVAYGMVDKVVRPLGIHFSYGASVKTRFEGIGTLSVKTSSKQNLEDKLTVG